MKKKLLAVLLSMTMVFSLAACGASNSNNGVSTTGTESASPGSTETKSDSSSTATSPLLDASRTSTANADKLYDKVVMSLSADPQDLMPYNPNNVSKPYIYPEIYECLFDMNGADYTPALAKGYTVVDDLHYDVQIWDTIYDSEGNHITADDIVYDYNWLLSTGQQMKYDYFQSISKVDDYTVEFTWTKAPTDVGALEFPWCRTMIFSQKAFESHNFATDPVGTGPYTLESFVSGSKIVLLANEKYWQTDSDVLAKMTPTHTANVKTIEYDIILESAQATIALETGTVDFSLNAQTTSLSEFKEGGEFADTYGTFQQKNGLYYYLQPNVSEDSLMSDINLRLAVYYAIDNGACAKAAGDNAVASKGIGSDFYSDYVADWNEQDNYITTYDPDKAKEYLEKSSYNGETLTFLLKNDEMSKNMAVLLQSMLLNVGINVKIQTQEDSVYNNTITETGSWDMALQTLGGGTLISSYNLLCNNKETTGGTTKNFISDDKLQSLFETAVSLDGHTADNMTSLYNYIIENAYFYGVVELSGSIVYNKDIAEIYYREGYPTMGACTYYLK